MPDQPATPSRIYYAGPLFSQMERRWNREVADLLAERSGVALILPQDFEGEGEAGSEEYLASIFRQCVEGVDQCDAVLAILDGADADSGTSFEMGYAYALGKPIVGVRTDFRRQQDRGTNIMTARCCAAYIHETSVAAEPAAIVSEIEQHLRDLGLL